MMTQAPVLKRYREEELVAVGLVRTSGGACLRGALRGTARRVAVKLLSRSAAQSSAQLAQVEKALALGQVCSERVLVPLGLYRAGGLLGLVWDWMAEGSLHSLLYETQLYPDLPSGLRLQLLLDVAEGLKLLHDVPVVHGALKTTNVLLDQQYRAKLCDWGQQGVLDLRASVSGAGGPCFRDLAYMSPEVLEGGVPSVKSDIYSFGVLIWEVMNRRRPCECLDHLQTLLLFTAEPKLLPPDTPQCPALTQLIISCCSNQPSQRPLAEECVEELRKAVASFSSEVSADAALRLRSCRERALLNCKHSAGWELPIELNNLEGSSGSACPKILTSKTMPLNVICLNNTDPQSSRSEGTSPRASPALPTAARASPPSASPPSASPPSASPPSPSPPSASPPSPSPPSASPPSACPRTPCPPTACCRESPSWSRRPPSISCHSPGLRQCAAVCGVNQTRTSNPTPPNTPCGSPTTAIQNPCYRNQGCQRSSAGWSCCRLLQERREVIVHRMTEGRLNNLLDVLRSRQAVTRESYELITAALTLTARTRCLLDVCACLGENVSILVASTLGLVSAGAARGHARPRTPSTGQAG
ncbi:receptor-interacting serine/threonine-protein kinase 2 isoform X1 [Astyanax mexicanus]|uniref:receptor-interacting serine/threonine-protein kinase 2 isoform X1 n=1 Tax=Astyanax mexicanus TaxID=7994 RepID=UPI0020CAB1D2|nr:receptor-interacting serine/threonine-protein kinase 2 isoform X1 [Astyanax mexicanus]